MDLRVIHEYPHPITLEMLLHAQRFVAKRKMYIATDISILKTFLGVLLIGTSMIMTHLYFLRSHYSTLHLERFTMNPTVWNPSVRKFGMDPVEHSDANTKSTKSPTTAELPHQCHYEVQLYERSDIPPATPFYQKFVSEYKGPLSINCSDNCTIRLTKQNERYKFAGMDAVLFHFEKHYVPKPLPPANMNPVQTWVYYSFEPSSRDLQEPVQTSKLQVQASWTYHRGSEIVSPYGHYIPGLPMSNKTKPAEQWLEGKTKFILWIASNCRSTSWPRLQFVHELRKHVHVDIYGPCGNLTCLPRFSNKCNVDLLRQYKFYLSLESSECDDYITEKFWRKPLLQGVVPIVYGPGRKTYEDLAPPNSFIYLGDYKNITELANYLKLLDSKPELYAKYFEWRYNGSVRIGETLERYDPLFYCNVIPVIEKVKRGELKRLPMGQRQFLKSCRKSEGINIKKKAAFGLGKWFSW